MRWRRAARPVLDGVDLHVPGGTLVAIRGANGAGKTTLLRAIAGLVVPERGRIAVDGHDPSVAPRAVRRRVAYLPAGTTGLYARLGVRAHLEMWARVGLLPRSARRGAVERALADFGLEQVAHARADRLSTGQRQRVRLATTFLAEPRVVLLDEPRASLDPDGVALLARAVAAVAGRGGAVVWCTPAGEDAGIEPDASLVLAEGRLHAA